MTDANDLYYMRARFYSPDLRRFINQDILLGNIDNGQSLNRYAYVTGNPISFIDPFGLEKVLSEQEVQGLYERLARMDLAFDNIKGGCEARTYFMIKEMQKLGHSPFKAWAFPFPRGKRLSIKGRENEVKWWSFHVAPGVRGYSNGEEVDIVFDPGLFNRPATFQEWLDILNNETHSDKTAPNEIPTRADGTPYEGSYVPGTPDSDFPSTFFGIEIRKTIEGDSRRTLKKLGGCNQGCE